MLDSDAVRRGLLLISATCIAALAMGATAQALTWSPANLDFGKQNVGTKGVPQQVVLKGGGCGPDIFDGMNIIPGPCFPDPLDVAVSGDFVITSSNCPAVLQGPTAPPAATCTVAVAFKPNAVGPLTGFLRLKNNPIEGVPLSGTGCLKPRKGKGKPGGKKTKKTKRRCAARK